MESRFARVLTLVRGTLLVVLILVGTVGVFSVGLYAVVEVGSRVSHSCDDMLTRSYAESTLAEARSDSPTEGDRKTVRQLDGDGDGRPCEQRFQDDMAQPSSVLEPRDECEPPAYYGGRGGYC